VLRRAVKEHLESDVPVATFLSGGIDSSLVTAYANDAAPGTIKAYSIGFSEERFDESPFARETAAKIGVPISVEMFDEETARAKLPDVLLAYDEPFGDSSSLATYLLSSHVARDYKVALGGDGGDEVFAGYLKYHVVRLRKPFASTPRLRDALGRSFRRVSTIESRARTWARLSHSFRRAGRALSGSDAYVYAQLTQIAPLAKTAPIMRVAADPQRFEREAQARFEKAHGTELQRSLASDLTSALCNDMLVKVDRASMACHLEARVPFLDHRVAEYGIGLPEAYTLGESTRRWAGKRVLRALHERRFGSVLANRKKQGFGVPVEKWLRGPFDAACERLFARSRLDRFGILASTELSDGGFRRWIGIDPSIVWHAFALAAWCEANLGDGPDALRAQLAV
ncbi:MAG TPA: asparagine synthase C-terminal domain-containing protein, partial [Labilithrix sp.]|nr:asparagine synthase C-terminal domain-containing protein [Labilithrix sp.]